MALPVMKLRVTSTSPADKQCVSVTFGCIYSLHLGCIYSLHLNLKSGTWSKCSQNFCSICFQKKYHTGLLAQQNCFYVSEECEITPGKSVNIKDTITHHNYYGDLHRVYFNTDIKDLEPEKDEKSVIITNDYTFSYEDIMYSYFR